jgi:hypothetical protein
VIGWAIWLFGGVAGTFAAYETWALITGHATLSRWVWTVSKAFPLFPWIAGVLTGGLAVHFWWGGIVCFPPVH